MGSPSPAGNRPSLPAWWPWLAVAAVLLLVAGAYVALALRSGVTAASGTTVSGVEIGGMTQEQAAAALAARIAEDSPAKIKVTALDHTQAIRPAQAGIELDAAASVAPAYGSTWNPATLLHRLLGTGDRLDAVVRVDDAKLSEALTTLVDAVAVPATEPTVEVRRGTVRSSPGAPGRALDVEATGSALVAAVVEPSNKVNAVVVELAPTVSDSAVQQARATAEAAVAAPIRVTAGSVSATIPARAVGRALSFTADGGALVPSLDGGVLHRAIADDLAAIETKGRDASFRIKRGVVKVVKSKVGTGVSDEELAAAVAGVLDQSGASRSVTVSVGTREPALSTKDAEALGIKTRLSTFTQHFPYAAYRTINIGQAAKRVNGTLLMPGDSFSMNETIKERTKANGYTEGTVIGVGGVFEQDLGGGVSTATTATWTAAFFAGMERVQSVAHSIYISRYQPGLEATVAWGIFDMKFRNPYSNAVFITASATGTSVTVSFWGTPEYSAIKAEFGERRDIVPYETIHDASKTCLGQGGVDGFTITVDRVFYQDGKEIRREPITTRYKAAPKVVCGPEKDGKGKGKGKGNGKNTSTTSPSPPGEPTSKPTESDVFDNG